MPFSQMSEKWAIGSQLRPSLAICHPAWREVRRLHGDGNGLVSETNSR
jgi:hypothetical protein